MPSQEVYAPLHAEMSPGTIRRCAACDEFAVVLVGVEGVQPWEVDLIRQYYVEGDYVDGDYVAVRRDALQPSLELVRMYASCVTGLAVSRILVEVTE